MGLWMNFYFLHSSELRDGSILSPVDHGMLYNVLHCWYNMYRYYSKRREIIIVLRDIIHWIRLNPPSEDLYWRREITEITRKI